MDLLLTEPERENLMAWKPVKYDRSLTTKILQPLWKFVASLIPDSVAPNLLSIAGMLATIHAFYITIEKTINPKFSAIAVCSLVLFYWVMDAVDGIHAKRTKNDSNLGSLFNLSCCIISTIFLSLTLGSYYELTIQHQWYLMMTIQLILLFWQLGTYKTGKVEFSLVNGPGECLAVMMLLIGLRGFVGHASYKLVYLKTYIGQF